MSISELDSADSALSSSLDGAAAGDGSGDGSDDNGGVKSLSESGTGTFGFFRVVILHQLASGRQMWLSFDIIYAVKRLLQDRRLTGCDGYMNNDCGAAIRVWSRRVERSARK